HPLGERRADPRRLRRLRHGAARAGPVAARARRRRGSAQDARGSAGRLLAVSRVRPQHAGAVRAATRYAHRLHVGLDRAALGGPVLSAGVPELSRHPLLDARVRGADRDRGVAGSSTPALKRVHLSVTGDTTSAARGGTLGAMATPGVRVHWPRRATPARWRRVRWWELCRRPAARAAWRRVPPRRALWRSVLAQP